MNEDLCELPRQLYGSNYRPVARNKDWKLTATPTPTAQQQVPRRPPSTSIGGDGPSVGGMTRRVSMRKGASGDEEEEQKRTHPLLGLARSAVQDERAIVALRLYSSPPSLSTTTKTGESSAEALSVAVGLEEREAQIVAMLSLILWNHSGYADTSRRNQKAFWREKLFVVTPRHVQRYCTPVAIHQSQQHRSSMTPSVCCVCCMYYVCVPEWRCVVRLRRLGSTWAQCLSIRWRRCRGR